MARFCIRGHDTRVHGRNGSRMCRQCSRDATRAWRLRNPERAKAAAKTYLPGWRERNAEKVEAYGFVRYWSDAERFRAAARQARTPEENRAHVRAWRLEHPDRVRVSLFRWFAKHPGAMREHWARRRARKRDAVTARITSKHLALLLEAQDGCCRYCSAPLGKDKHLDHRVPLARGGAHTPDNVCWACPKCNQSKSARLYPEEWRPAA